MFLTIDQVAEYIGVPVRTVYNWRNTGRSGGGPPAYRIGRQLRYKQTDVDTWIETRRETLTDTKPPTGLDNPNPRPAQ